jgi:hypothetical protein
VAEPRPDTDEHAEPGGSPTQGQDNLIRKPVTPGTDDAGSAAAVPGAHESDDDERARGKAVKPGN